MAYLSSFRALRRLGLEVLQRSAIEVATAPVQSITADAPALEAITRMMDLRAGAILVGGNGVYGILTERDVLRRLDCERLQSHRCGDLMTPASELRLARTEWSLERCLEAMKQGNFRHMPVSAATPAADGLDEHVAMLSTRDVFRFLAAAVTSAPTSETKAEAHAFTAAHLIRKRSDSEQIDMSFECGGARAIVKVAPSASVAEAVTEMRGWSVSSVLIPEDVPEAAAPSPSGWHHGIFTERDLMQLLARAARAPSDLDTGRLAVSSVMTPARRVHVVTLETPVIECMELMVREGVRHLPVVEGTGAASADARAARVRAMISMRDVANIFLET